VASTLGFSHVLLFRAAAYNTIGAPAGVPLECRSVFNARCAQRSRRKTRSRSRFFVAVCCRLGSVQGLIRGLNIEPADDDHNRKHPPKEPSLLDKRDHGLFLHAALNTAMPGLIATTHSDSSTAVAQYTIKTMDILDNVRGPYQKRSPPLSHRTCEPCRVVCRGVRRGHRNPAKSAGCTTATNGVPPRDPSEVARGLSLLNRRPDGLLVGTSHETSCIRNLQKPVSTDRSSVVKQSILSVEPCGFHRLQNRLQQCRRKTRSAVYVPEKIGRGERI